MCGDRSMFVEINEAKTGNVSFGDDSKIPVEGKVVHEKTPQEAWSGRKLGISHLKVFKSISYTHVLDERRTKLDDKNEKNVLVGYDSSSKRYKLYNPNSGKNVISRDVEFEEEYCWDWSVQEDRYDILPYFKEEEEMEQPMIEEHITPSASATPRLDETSSSERTPQLRSIEELYEVTENINDINLF
ncbi:hypothetical protein KIW84_015677 [Lathyrus oleraceus]|uniref:Retroviral polymerase SH3-like domain-containing protein n=1 Tax=Pisum sativum TaxID=3888 RepID=A0A9D5BRG5_PEA|nr:hypothetical protein KIW84_015677 [Pisum sativum]